MKEQLLNKVNFPMKKAPTELKGKVFSQILKEKSQVQFMDRMNLVYRLTIASIFVVVAFGVGWVYYFGENIDNGSKIHNIEITQSGIDSTIESLEVLLTLVDNEDPKE
ncbi:MAG: hypothetical protein V3575_04470, partial [Candidatus Absconditabacteria bacterium]